jgi:hypothetical protein
MGLGSANETAALRTAVGTSLGLAMAYLTATDAVRSRSFYASLPIGPHLCRTPGADLRFDEDNLSSEIVSDLLIFCDHLRAQEGKNPHDGAPPAAS